MNKSSPKNRNGFALARKPETEKLNKRNGFTIGFSAFNYNHQVINFQYKRFSSDYNIGNSDGLCVDCLQKAEFIIRERPYLADRVQCGGLQ